ncbi:hypothetical protein E1L19_01050 [Salmonella enterica subsp. enterica]|nr:hypothetical protein [Salmonella enterica subsp. enterica serovar Reading]ECI7824593.1 hypothetical protein [Salmonella enterica subsp. enterica]ECN6005610.1 hypothetical protein [Salmonella enterica subsp. enterica serovar Brandenburg]EDA0852602.1 hypothetical protein [Salmonella enterica]EDU6784117.1 hypothetical protein [Salmonella enterica subsp. enterica serovar Gaminara]EHB3478020.1 hypothetical protein [Salmonella enterica subsp. enterica serovar Newport]
MDIREIRQKRLKEWFADKKLPPKDASFISQVIGGKFIGEKAARRLERDHCIPEFHLDKPFDDDNSSSFDPANLKQTSHEMSEKLVRVQELLNTLPDAEAALLVDKFFAQVKERTDYYEQRFQEYLLKNKLK